jgi:hypothetical protein
MFLAFFYLSLSTPSISSSPELQLVSKVPGAAKKQNRNPTIYIMPFHCPCIVFLFIVLIFVIKPVAHSLPFIVLHGNCLLLLSIFFFLPFFGLLFEFFSDPFLYLALFFFWVC